MATSRKGSKSDKRKKGKPARAAAGSGKTAKRKSAAKKTSGRKIAARKSTPGKSARGKGKPSKSAGGKPPKKGAKRKTSKGAAVQTGRATTGRPKLVAATRAVLLASPPQPSAEELRSREMCVDHTHRSAGPEIKESPRTRAMASESIPDIPPSAPRTPDETGQ